MSTSTPSFFVVEILNSRGGYDPTFNTATGFVHTYPSNAAAVASVQRYCPWDYIARAFRIVGVS